MPGDLVRIKEGRYLWRKEEHTILSGSDQYIMIGEICFFIQEKEYLGGNFNFDTVIQILYKNEIFWVYKNKSFVIIEKI